MIDYLLSVERNRQAMTMNAKFGGKCTACGTWFPAGTMIEWAKGAGAKHASPAVCEAAKAAAAAAKPAPVAVNVGSFSGVVALFETAKAHLKFPKIRLVVNGTKITLSLNGPRSKTPGSISISGEGVYPNRPYYGRVSPEGAFFPFRMAAEFETALTAVLTKLAADPAGVAKEHGKLTGNCCFCNKVLGLGEDKRSIVVGFGPRCAEHFGLKAEWLSGVAAVAPLASAA
jgi:hypothetical protein